jgi:hypothetical protein
MNRIWLTSFFAFGTIMWYETVNGSSWEVSMLVAVLMTLLALNELYGKGRPLLVGLWAGLAGIARYDLVLVWPVYVLCTLSSVAEHPVSNRQVAKKTASTCAPAGLGRTSILAVRFDSRRVLQFIPGFALAAVIYVWFNWARFGTITDTAFSHYNPLNGNIEMTSTPTLFAWRYFPGNFFTLFFMAPRLDATFPYIHPQAGGQSILTTSPAFLLALRASWKRLDVDLMGLAAILAALPVLFYVGNGMSQYGTRHFVAVFPFLLVLMGMAELDQMGKALIVVSICLMALGMYSIRVSGL